MTLVGASDLRLLLPELWLSTFACAVLLLSAAWPVHRRRTIGALAIIGLFAALAILVWTQGGVALSTTPGPERPGAFAIADGTPSFVADGFAFYFKVLFLIAGILTIAMSLSFLDLEGAQAGEYYALILLAVSGMMFMSSGVDLLVLYIGLEMMALSVYVLVGFLRLNRASNEAALKYFLLGAFSSAIFLYGVSLIYAATRSTNLLVIHQRIAQGVESERLLLVGVLLTTVALAFKVAAVPFHMWTPDAYEGAPTTVTGFMSTAVKAAAFAFLLRIYVDGLIGMAGSWVPLVALLSAASMTLGNVTAVLQDNVKRLLAYSSIAHAGYMLMGLVAIGALDRSATTIDGMGSREYGLIAILVYVAVYTFMNLGAFAVLVMLRRGGRAGETIRDFGGLGRTHPGLAFAMLVFLLSLAGIPCTAGFIGKWYLFGATIRAGYGWLAVLAVVNSAISLYYYVRIVVAMYMGAPDGEEAPSRSPALMAAMTVSLVATLAIGLYPSPLVRLARLVGSPGTELEFAL